MAKKMLIDATHAEETRVVVVDGNKVEEFDFESENKRQLAGNIYLAKVTRVEPSLQAAFVDYGGNRHGFLAFSEIHPDYYQIPIADRKALMEEEAALAAEEEEERERPKKRTRGRSRRKPSQAENAKSDDEVITAEPSREVSGMETIDLGDDTEEGAPGEGLSPMETVHETPVADPDELAAETTAETTAEAEAPAAEAEAARPEAAEEADDDGDDEADDGDDDEADAASKDESIESVSDDDSEEDIRPRRKPRPRKYKIQEVIKVRQILLVQVVKEERGNKGAALTTYLSLAGRYCVLMPNTARGGGISRKITNAADRSKLKEIAGEIDVPKGAGLIIRTAGAKRTKTEIKRDYEYLQRLWEQIRELTLKSSAPAKIYEEGDLIKRSIRDLYNREIDEVLVEGERGYRIAKDFMKMIMPSHAKNVKHYVDQMPLFARHQVESYLSGMFNPTVQLKSGGYIVIGVTEALVAIDVNSGRATKEGSIEETATKTNLEAAEEVARQLRLRDLAGLIVIDFIDMDERKNNAAVEKKLKDKLKTDRARIQVGRISGFGLLEMSRQRLRPGMIEATTAPCPSCHGTGLIRSDDNMALQVLRQIEEEGTRRRSREVLVKCPVSIANYLMNQKREHIAQIESRYGMSVRIEGDAHLVAPDYTMEKFKTATRAVPEVVAPVVSVDTTLMDEIDGSTTSAWDDEDEAEAAEAAEAAAASPSASEDDKPKKRRRRRRRRKNGNGDDNGQDMAGDQDGESADTADAPAEPAEAAAEAEAGEPAVQAEAEAEEKPKRKRSTRSRSRAKTVKSDDEATAEGDVQEATAEAAPKDDTAEAEDAPKPKAKRTRTRKKKAPEPEAEAQEAEAQPEGQAAPEAETTAQPEPAAAEPQAEASEEAQAPKAPAKPRRTRRKAAEVIAEVVGTADETTEAAPAAEPVAETAQPEPAPEPVAEVSEAEPVVETATAEPAVETVAEASAEDDKPKKRGWWSLGR
ncbi:ribonuclease E/G [Tropicibacter oceani]|uniref:Ribonuclease E n=1 Tax=Tropicibacter oceani TaxID=3058420 RepID=A0ABY8QES0_9RHOB|nr:ribonuclease E/G [Tropicibacter oceani]WGW03109.1 Rne/Rng family ribonuclease [Tropicibacter oceani]